MDYSPHALSREFSRLEYWSGLPFPSPRKFADLRIEPGFPVLQADSLPSEPPRKHVCPVPNFSLAKKSRRFWKGVNTRKKKKTA